MARGRMLNRAVAEDGKVAAYGDEFGPIGLVFHHRLIAFLDVNGNVRADPHWLKGTVMPRVAGCSPDDCRTLAAGLGECDLAVPYEIDGNPYLHFPQFRANQTGLRTDRESPEVPVPQGFDDSSGCFPDNVRQPAGNLPEDVRSRAAARAAASRAEVEVEVEREVEEQQLRQRRVRAREEPRGMNRLRDLLGDSAAALAAADLDILGSSTWPAAIVGMYGPAGTKRHTLRDLSAPDVSAVLAESVIVFAGERRDWHQPFFDSIVKRVADYRRNGGPEIDGMSDADRRLLQRRIEMESWDLNAEMER